MNNFSTYKLKEISNFEYGKMPDKHKISAKGYPIFSGYRQAGYYPEYMYEKEKLIIIARGVGGTGKVKISPPFAYVTNLSIIFNENVGVVDYKYLYYYLSIIDLKSRLDTGSCQSQITINELAEYKVTIPSIENQKRIANVLSCLDSKIEINNRINNELEVMTKSLYDYWFVQFDFPDSNGRPYKSSGGRMAWNDKLKKEIPEGWNSGNLFNNPFTEIIKPKINKFDGFKKYLATADINNREVGGGSDITYEKRESRANMQPIKNSIWFAKMKASKKHLFIGECGDDLVSNYILSTGFTGLKCKDFAFEFISSFIASDNFEIIKDTISHGATMQGIGNDDLNLVRLVIPNENILLQYKELTSPMYFKMEMIRLENKKLTELRDWLLPMLMNGQVKVA